MSEIRTSNISNSTNTSGTIISGITTFTSEGYLQLPSGTTGERVGIESGSLRYNETYKTIEFYDGTEWKYVIPGEENPSSMILYAGGYGAFVRGFYVDTISYINPETLGNARYFGDLSLARGYYCGCSNKIRSLNGGGIGIDGGSWESSIEFVTFATKGNASIFANLINEEHNSAACSNEIRGVFIGGEINVPVRVVVSTMEYVTIAVRSNGRTFGNMVTASQQLCAASSSTRGIFAGGDLNTAPLAASATSRIEYITFASTGGSLFFGNLVNSVSADIMTAACSSPTRAIMGDNDTFIQYITIATTGNSEFFGEFILPPNLTIDRNGALRRGSAYYKNAASSKTRGIFGGGVCPSPYMTFNLLQYCTISTLGDAKYFGDLQQDLAAGAMTSNNHGGL